MGKETYDEPAVEANIFLFDGPSLINCLVHDWENGEERNLVGALVKNTQPGGPEEQGKGLIQAQLDGQNTEEQFEILAKAFPLLLPLQAVVLGNPKTLVRVPDAEVAGLLDHGEVCLRRFAQQAAGVWTRRRHC